MEKKFEQLKRGMRNIALTAGEKRAMRETVFNFVEMHPREKTKIIYAPSFSFALPLSLILLLFFGGISYAAEDSLPGDLLYPIKVYVNEEVGAVLARSSEAKASLAVKKALRRLEEAEKLSVEEKLDLSTREVLESRFEIEVKNFEEHALKTKRIERAEISSEFESALRVHSEILSKLAQVKEKSKPARDRVKETLESVAKTRRQAESDVSEADHKEVEAKKRSAKGKIGEAAKEVDSEELKEAKRIFADGEEKLEMQRYNEAFKSFQKATRIAEEKQLISRSKKNLKIDVSSRDAGEKDGQEHDD